MKDKLKFLSIYYVWMVLGIPLVALCGVLKIDLNIKFNYAIANVILEAFMFIFVFILYKKEFAKDFKSVKKDKNYFKEIIKFYGGEIVVSVCAGVLIYSLSDFLGLTITGGSENNKLVQSLLKSAPIFMAVGTVVFGPFYEEGIMRLGLKKGIKNKGVFAIVSGFIFGIMHVVDNLFILFTLPLLGFLLDYVWNMKDKIKKYLLSATSIITYIGIVLGVYYLIHHNFNIVDINNFIYIISYVSVGIYFAIIYLKKNNIFYTIGTHMMVNVISTILLFFI